MTLWTLCVFLKPLNLVRSEWATHKGSSQGLFLHILYSNISCFGNSLFWSGFEEIQLLLLVCISSFVTRRTIHLSEHWNHCWSTFWSAGRFIDVGPSNLCATIDAWIGLIVFTWCMLAIWTNLANIRPKLTLVGRLLMKPVIFCSVHNSKREYQTALDSCRECHCWNLHYRPSY